MKTKAEDCLSISYAYLTAAALPKKRHHASLKEVLDLSPQTVSLAFVPLFNILTHLRLSHPQGQGATQRLRVTIEDAS